MCKKNGFGYYCTFDEVNSSSEQNGQKVLQVYLGTCSPGDLQMGKVLIFPLQKRVEVNMNGLFNKLCQPFRGQITESIFAHMKHMGLAFKDFTYIFI